MTTTPRLPDLGTRLRKLEKDVQILQRTSRLSNASIGSGGLRIYDGGFIRVEDEGNIYLDDGGDLIVNGGGHIALTDGGIFTIDYAGGSQFLGTGSESATTAAFLLKKPNGFNLVQVSVSDALGKGQVRIGQEIDPDPPDIFLEATNFGIGSVANLVLNPGNLLKFLNIQPQVGSANLRINASGDVGTESSLRSMKENIEPLEVDTDKVLAVEPMTFTSKADPEDGTMAGVIADDVEALGGLEAFLLRDADGNLQGFDYGTFPMALLEVIKKQQTQIDDLTARLTQMEEAQNG